MCFSPGAHCTRWVMPDPKWAIRIRHHSQNGSCQTQNVHFASDILHKMGHGRSQMGILPKTSRTIWVMPDPKCAVRFRNPSNYQNCHVHRRHFVEEICGICPKGPKHDYCKHTCTPHAAFARIWGTPQDKISKHPPRSQDQFWHMGLDILQNLGHTRSQTRHFRLSHPSTPSFPNSHIADTLKFR